MARMLRVWYGPGGQYPGQWSELAHVYRVHLEYFLNHPSQLEVECGSTGGDPPPLLSCIRVTDPNYTAPGEAPMFYGRIDEVRPVHTTNVGHVWRIRARDFLAALADNTVGHPMENGCVGCMPVDPSTNYYVPNWRFGRPDVNAGCIYGEETPNGYNCGAYREMVIKALVLGVAQAFANVQVDPPGSLISEIIAPDFLHSTSKSILQVIQELADGGTWQETDWPWRVRAGWDFRQSLFGGEGGTQPAYLMIMPRGKLWWDRNITWAWKEHGSTRVTITDYKVFDHGYDLYSRAYVMGSGEVSGLATGYPVDNYGMVTPHTYQESSNKENWWNPSQGYFRVQRDATEIRLGVTDKALLSAYGIAKIHGDGYDYYYTGRKMQLTTVGFPRNAYGYYPSPGTRIFVQGIPGIAAQSFVISRLQYDAPEGITVVDLGLPRDEAGLKMASMQGLARQGVAGGTPQRWIGPWWCTAAGSPDYEFYHGLGVRPSNVHVDIVKTPSTCSSGRILEGDVNTSTITAAPEGYREEDGRWAGYWVLVQTRDKIKIRFAHFMGYSGTQAEIAGNVQAGWLQLGDRTAFRIVLSA